MKDILEAIVANKQKELEQWKQYVPLKQLYGIIEYEGAMKREVPSLKAALSGSSTIGVIAEFVRKTPALGWINKDAKIRNVGADYAHYGATAISVPTDFTYFGGYDEFVQEARAVGITLPLLYSLELANLLPASMLKISEGGFDTPETAKQLAAVGYQGVIIGEPFMQAEIPGIALGEFIKKLKE